MKTYAYHFWSPTCAPCKVIKPAIEDLKEEFSSVQWVSVNTHEDPADLAKKYGVSVVPTIVVLTVDDQGSPVLTEKHSGTTMMGYYRILRSAMKLA
jgi:thioredoxin 1